MVTVAGPGARRSQPPLRAPCDACRAVAGNPATSAPRGAPEPIGSPEDVMRLPQLSLATWSARCATTLPEGVTGPTVDPRELRSGQVHLGLGAFQRAHQE